MTVALAFTAGCAFWWMSARLFTKYGMRWVAGDRKARVQLLDGLGYESLLKMREAVEDELKKRRAS